MPLEPFKSSAPLTVERATALAVYLQALCSYLLMVESAIAAFHGNAGV